MLGNEFLSYVFVFIDTREEHSFFNLEFSEFSPLWEWGIAKITFPSDSMLNRRQALRQGVWNFEVALESLFENHSHFTLYDNFDAAYLLQIK